MARMLTDEFGGVVPDTVEEYGEAQRLLKFLDNFCEFDEREIPPTSLLREFIGGSSFTY